MITISIRIFSLTLLSAVVDEMKFFKTNPMRPCKTTLCYARALLKPDKEKLYGSVFRYNALS